MKSWNYETPSEFFSYQKDWNQTFQKDWNQTLIVKFNELSVNVHSATLIKVPKKFEDLINSLEFYHNSNQTIGSKFKIEFTESDENTIYVGEHKLDIQNFR